MLGVVGGVDCVWCIVGVGLVVCYWCYYDVVVECDFVEFEWVE